MGYWDITLLIIIAIFTVKGYFKGLIWELLRIAGIILAYLFSHNFYIYFAKFLQFLGFSKEMSKIFGYFILFITIFIGIVVLSYFLKKFFKAIKLGWVDTFGGAAFGFLKSVVILSLILSFLISIIPSNSGLYKTVMQSNVSSKIVAINPFIMQMINKIFGEKGNVPFVNRRELTL
ncbi:MAG: CvpA family protein [Deferribacterales bacterium]